VHSFPRGKLCEKANFLAAVTTLRTGGSRRSLFRIMW